MGDDPDAVVMNMDDFLDGDNKASPPSTPVKGSTPTASGASTPKAQTPPSTNKTSGNNISGKAAKVPKGGTPKTNRRSVKGKTLSGTLKFTRALMSPFKKRGSKLGGKTSSKPQQDSEPELMSIDDMDIASLGPGAAIAADLHADAVGDAQIAAQGEQEDEQDTELDPEVVEICGRIAEGKTTEMDANPRRRLLREGIMFRQAKMKKVHRCCFLFSDIFLFTKPLDKSNKKLEQKQIVDLLTLELDQWTEGKTQMNHAFCMRTPEREFVVACETEELRTEWIKALSQAIRVLKPNRGDDEGPLQGSLQAFAEAGDIARITALIAKGALVNDQDVEGNTALHMCARNGGIVVMDILLSHGANAAVTNKEGRMPLYDAALQGKTSALEKLLAQEYEDSYALKEQRQIALCGVAAQGTEVSPEHLVVIKMLLDTNGLNVDEARDDHGRTALHIAVSNDKLILAELLLAAGARTDTTCTGNGFSALHYASQANALQSAELLLDSGAGPNIGCYHGSTPLHLCGIPLPQIPLACLLVGRGARLGLKDQDGRVTGTPFDGNDAVVAACEQWKNKKDATIIGKAHLSLDKEHQWVGDGTSDLCLLCNAHFTLTHRRHHCRRCGLLVCAPCSAKKFTAPGQDKALRICDGCYNLITSKRDVERALRAKQEQEEEDERMKQETEEDEALRRQLKQQKKQINDGDKRRALLQQQQAKTMQAHQRAGEMDEAAEVASLARQNVNKMKERGVLLEALEDKSEALEDDAKEFASLASKLKDKFKKGH